MSLQPSNRVRSVYEIINEVAAGSPDPQTVYRSFQSNEALRETLAEAARVDTISGEFNFAAGQLSFQDPVYQSSPQTVIETYMQTFMDWTIDNRPSLPTVALAELRTVGVDIQNQNFAEQPETDIQAISRAMMLTAARSEMIQGQPPTEDMKAQAAHYHDVLHYTNATQIASFLMDHNNELNTEGKSPFQFSDKQRLLVTLTMLGHDMDHPGGGNAPGNPFQLEQKSFDAMLPLIEQSGMNADDIADLKTLLLATSPTPIEKGYASPSNIVRKLAIAQKQGETLALQDLDQDNRYPELARLQDNPELIQMAAVISDSDLYASAFAGMDANIEMSDRLTNEIQTAQKRANPQIEDENLMNLRGDGPRLGFSKFIVLDEAASFAGADLGQDQLTNMLAETNAKISAAKTASEQKPKPTL